MAERRRLKVQADIQLPTLPNYVRLVGLSDAAAGLDVADLTDASLMEIGAAWSRALLEHAKNRRAEREKDGV
jgi:hypothetical protein